MTIMKHTCRGVVAAFLVSSALVMVGTTAANALDPLPIVSDTNMANRPSNDRELHIAVDPNDPNHLAAGANTRGSGNGQRWYVSTDGGTTWTDGVLPFGTINSDGNPTNATMSDPSVAFGSNGEIYYSALTNGSNAPCDLFVSVSSDDGATWTDPANGLIAEGGTSVCNDKQMILVDNANNDNVYAAWTPFGGGNNLELVFSRDTGGNTGGLAFSAPVVLSTDSAQNSCQNHGADLAQQANGDLYVSWTTFCNGLTDGANSTVWVARSTDLGLTFSAPVTVAATDNVAPNIATGFRARTFPSIEADPATGRLFVVYSDYTDSDGGDADILISSSSDNGATWTAPSEVDEIGRAHV